MRREQMMDGLPSERWALLVLLALLPATVGAGCREAERGPQPKNREQAAQLTKQGHSFAARHRPAWVDQPGGATSRPGLPAGWVRAGRSSWVFGRMEIQKTQPLFDLVGDQQTLVGRRVRLHALAKPCADQKSLLLLEDRGKRLVAVLPGEPPPFSADQPAVLEGELRAPASEAERRAVARCQGGAPALLLGASAVSLRLDSGR